MSTDEPGGPGLLAEHDRASWAIASRGVAGGEVTAAVTITVCGEIDGATLERIHELLEDLVGTRSMVVADLYRAQCRTGRLPPDLETADLTEVFGAYRDIRRPR